MNNKDAQKILLATNNLKTREVMSLIYLLVTGSVLTDEKFDKEYMPLRQVEEILELVKLMAGVGNMARKVAETLLEEDKPIDEVLRIKQFELYSQSWKEQQDLNQDSAKSKAQKGIVDRLYIK